MFTKMALTKGQAIDKAVLADSEADLKTAII